MTARWTCLAMLLASATALTCCDEGEGGKAASTARDRGDTTTDVKATGGKTTGDESEGGKKGTKDAGAEDADAEGGAQGSPHGKDIPTIPTKAEPKPDAAAFADAPTVNTAPKERRPSHCTMKLAGQWLQIDCKAEGMISVREQDWGTAGKDYVDGSPLYLRLRPGTAQVGHLSPFDKTAVRLSVAWPEGAPKPWTIALEDKQALAKHEARVQQETTPIAEVSFERSAGRLPAAAWARAKPINTASAGDRPAGCAMETLQGWLRMRCVALGGLLLDLRLLDGFGKQGKDYYRRMTLAGQTIELELPLEAGHDYKALVTGDFSKLATLQVTWPKGDAKPSKVALTKK